MDFTMVLVIEDHKVAFGYSRYKDHYEKNGWDPETGTSPYDEIIPEDTPDGELYIEIDKTVENLD